MLKLELKDFEPKNLLAEVKYGGPDSHVWEGGYGLVLEVNGVRVIHPGIALMINPTLRSINNAFYTVLTTRKEGVMSFDLGCGERPQTITINKRDDKVLFRTSKKSPQHRPTLPIVHELDEEACDLIQSVEEVVRVTNQYKDTCMQVAQAFAPHDPWGFMTTIFGKEERYTKQLYDDENFDWVAYFSKKEEARNKTIIVHMARSREEANTLINQYIHKKEHDPSEKHFIIRNYYEWLPLETAWNRYKGRTDSSVVQN